MAWGSRPPPFLHFNEEYVMDIKTFMVAAVAALSVAACCKAPNNTEAIPADENATAQVELNDDGSVKTATDAATEEQEAAQAEAEAESK